MCGDARASTNDLQRRKEEKEEEKRKGDVGGRERRSRRRKELEGGELGRTAATPLRRRRWRRDCPLAKTKTERAPGQLLLLLGEQTRNTGTVSFSLYCPVEEIRQGTVNRSVFVDSKHHSHHLTRFASRLPMSILV